MAMRRSAVIDHVGAPFKIIDGPIPEPPAKGLIVKTSFGGICHSDIHVIDDVVDAGEGRVIKYSDRANFNYPLVLGHEVSGVVYSLGSDNSDDATGLCVGDRVAVYPWMACMQCGYCQHDEQNACSALASNVVGIGTDGGYSTFVTVPLRKFAVKIPDNVSSEVACMLTCSGITTYNAVCNVRDVIQRATKYKGAASLLVVGAGGLGLWTIQLARTVLPKSTKIICADITEEKLANAPGAGADDTIVWSGSDEASLIKSTRAKGLDGGIDGVIDLVNSAQTATRIQECLNKNAIHMCVGLFGGATVVPLPLMVYQMRTMKGVIVGSLNQFMDLIEILKTNNLTPPPIQYFKLEQIGEAMELLRQGKINGRGLVKHI